MGWRGVEWDGVEWSGVSVNLGELEQRTELECLETDPGLQVAASSSDSLQYLEYTFGVCQHHYID